MNKTFYVLIIFILLQNKDMAQEKKYVETPLMKQYYQIKAVYSDAILLFRVGDFYETFGDDAIEASSILGITLTRRANGAASFVELAGFPHHAVDTYLPKLVRAGKRVAICEQLEDPKLVKGLVKRGVIELVTPGVCLDNNVTERKENTFLAAVYFGKESTGVAFLDISTGEYFIAEGNDSYVDKLLSSMQPKEVVFQRPEEKRFTDKFSNRYYTYKLDEWVFSYDVNYDKLCKQFQTPSLKGFGVEDLHNGICAAGAILYYLEFTEHKNISHIRSISRIDRNDYVWLDRFSIRNLELFASCSGGKEGSLIYAIDKTKTAMGGRLLRRWLALPLMDIQKIRARQKVVSEFVQNQELSGRVADIISSIGDLERLSSRVASLRILPREFVQLKCSLESLLELKKELKGTGHKALTDIAQSIHDLSEVINTLATQLNQDPQTNQIAKGGIIADGVNAELDELRRIAYHGKDVIQQIQQRESEATGIPSLKVSYNNVFGYYIEVRNTHKDKVPEGWIRKQTLKDAERYITEELKEYEEKILGAEQHILEIEQRLYNDLIDYVQNYIAEIQASAHQVGRIDCLLSFAEISLQRNYTCPVINLTQELELKDARHPVIETLMKVGEEYIPNDIYLNSSKQQIMMITGPNMSGKSAILRQTALIVLLAQIGCFVPASFARIGVVDKIFTRVGASDNISQGESTFMVEMLESASILNNITDRSLVLLDEIGRGTSTYDGISIAWAMVEYLHNNPAAHPRTLFATHYHELNEMERSCERVVNWHVTVQEVDGTILFLRKLALGGTEHSFGIHVAKLAGMPSSIVERATVLLSALEKAYGQTEISPGAKMREREKLTKKPAQVSAFSRSAEPQPIQLSMFDMEDPVLKKIREELRAIDVNTLTPLDALNKINELKKTLDI